jgi:hypothetical protein
VIQCSYRGLGYGLHFTGATSLGVRFLELIQPVAVRRHGHGSVTARDTVSAKIDYED